VTQACTLCYPQLQALTRRAWTHSQAMKPICAVLSVCTMSAESGCKHMLTSVCPTLAERALRCILPIRAVQSCVRTPLIYVHSITKHICVQIAIATVTPRQHGYCNSKGTTTTTISHDKWLMYAGSLRLMCAWVLQGPTCCTLVPAYTVQKLSLSGW